jgi:hypothetical protein
MSSPGFALAGALRVIIARLIGSIRHECLDLVVVFGERHLRHLLSCYVATTTLPARTYPWAKMHRSNAPSKARAAFKHDLFSEDYTCVYRKSDSAITVVKSTEDRP